MDKSSTLISRISDIDIRLIKVFKAVVDCNGFAAAEVTLNKGKSAISMDMTDLEQRLDMTLCNRGRSGFSVTPQGRVVYEAANQLLNDLEAFRHKVSEAHKNPGGILKIFIADNSVLDPQSKLQNVLKTFSDLTSNAYIDVHGSSPKVIEQAVLEGRADIGITTLPRSTPSLNCQQLYNEDLFLYCGKIHPLFSCPPEQITLKSLYEYRFISIQVLHDTTLEGLLIPCNMAASADHLDARAALILTGNYLGFLPAHVAQPWTSNGEMRALLPEKMYTTNPFYAITKKGASKNPLLKRFIEIINDVFNQQHGV